jgi:hypothetical protein
VGPAVSVKLGMPSWTVLVRLDGVGAAGADMVHLGKFGVRAGEADFETLGFAVPAVGFGFGDAGEQVVADLFQPCAGGRIRAQQRAA